VVLARIELQRAERSLISAHVRLAETWGDGSPQFDAAVGDLDQLREVPKAEALASLINQNPDAARWAAEIASRQAEVELARAQAVPDLTASLGYRWFNESDDHALVAGVAIELPVLDDRQAEVLAARFGVAAAKNQRRAVELKLAATLSAAYAELVNAHDEATSLREQALPSADEAYDAIRQAFEQGNLGYLDVLDAERTLIDLRHQYLDALKAYHGAAAEIEGLIGQSLDTLSAADTQNTTPSSQETTQE
jgi:cobalt-zinc-cadmium efflux system outer membrane protein